jgi:hypothetical protein
MKPFIKDMIAHEGIYILGNTKLPEAKVVIVSMNGKLFSTKIDQELDSERFLDSAVLLSSNLAKMGQGAI